MEHNISLPVILSLVTLLAALAIGIYQ